MWKRLKESRWAGIPFPVIWFLYNLPSFLHDQATNLWRWHKIMMLIPEVIDPVGLILVILAVLVFFRPELIKVWRYLRPVKHFYADAKPITFHMGLSKATGRTTLPPWSVRIKNWFRRIGS